MQFTTPPNQWSQLLRGPYLVEQLQQRLTEWGPSLFGFSLVKVDPLSDALSLSSSRLQQSVQLNQLQHEGADLLGAATAMPFAPHSIDVCLLAHVLDYSDHRHDILREADIALRDDGWLIITGFNPYSCAGLLSLVPGLKHKLPPWRQMLAPGRLEDWLRLLGFEVLQRDYFGFTGLLEVPMLGALRRRLYPHYCPSLASVYIILARKRRYPLTPIRSYQPIRASLQPSMACQRHPNQQARRDQAE